MLLRTDGLTKTFKSTRAVADLTLAVGRGQLCVLLGPAGAGKTTSLRMIAGLDAPDRGRVLVDGADVTGLPPHRRDVAMVFDNLALYPNKTGFENIANPLRVARLPQADVERRVRRVAELLRVGHILARLPRTMSGGERQRIAFGRALVREPALFLLDEPLASLDAMLRLELRAELKRLQREHAYTFLMATPDFAEALAIADSVVLMRAGQVVQVASPQALYDDPVDLDAARFVGSPEINLVSARLEPDGGGRVRAGPLEFAAPAALLAGRAEAFDFTAGIRPEDVLLSPPDATKVCGRVVDVEPHGLKATLGIELGDATWRVSLSGSDDFRPRLGDAVSVHVAADRLRAFSSADGRRLS